MRPVSSPVLALLVFTAAAWISPSGVAVAQPAPSAAPQHKLPQGLIVEHEETLGRLTILAQRPGQVGVEARKALDLFKRHTAQEREYILPPLVLLPELAAGKVTPDMAWAVAMADRVKTDREQIFKAHTDETTVMIGLRDAGQAAHDREAVEFAESAVGDALNDVELLEPMVLVIGDYLRSRLPPAH